MRQGNCQKKVELHCEIFSEDEEKKWKRRDRISPRRSDRMTSKNRIENLEKNIDRIVKKKGDGNARMDSTEAHSESNESEISDSDKAEKIR